MRFWFRWVWLQSNPTQCMTLPTHCDLTTWISSKEQSDLGELLTWLTVQCYHLSPGPLLRDWHKSSPKQKVCLHLTTQLQLLLYQICVRIRGALPYKLCVGEYTANIPGELHVSKESVSVVVDSVEEVCRELECGAEDDHHVGKSHLVHSWLQREREGRGRVREFGSV